jgi:hypothetical protein
MHRRAAKRGILLRRESSAMRAQRVGRRAPLDIDSGLGPVDR